MVGEYRPCVVKARNHLVSVVLIVLIFYQINNPSFKDPVKCLLSTLKQRATELTNKLVLHYKYFVLIFMDITTCIRTIYGYSQTSRPGAISTFTVFRTICDLQPWKTNSYISG